VAAKRFIVRGATISSFLKLMGHILDNWSLICGRSFWDFLNTVMCRLALGPAIFPVDLGLVPEGSFTGYKLLECG
jgi:hypothetical protein